MKTKRQIINIDESKCDGCGNCVTGCHEGALQVIDGKARLISDLLCDGLGACIGECPRGAIKIEVREAVPYDEAKVMEGMVKHGPNTIKAHLQHLKDHAQKTFLKQAFDYMKENNIPNPMEEEKYMAHGKTHKHGGHEPCGCPGGRTIDLRDSSAGEEAGNPAAASQLRQWPVQLHLASPMAPYFQKADVVVAADCTAFAYGNFHNDFMKGKAIVIACPKLDEGQEIYVEKVQALIEDARINTLTVVTMEVPCCGGLLAMVKQAAAAAGRKVPIKSVVIGIQGGIKSEDWA
ncbi:MAG: 4Fe-4S ferredoxin [Elusimicrobia bacterium CG_4_10_14_0_2_um_filter_56_8]|nr:MAG: 4Fe-4S ferredoxin [Elusimicrobia bacterium CG1_02_56_21]PJA15158.1 MAG: 4Fe-4S ferredoxin [Elusimicrobia bacterium CG_4_10_14_0_2_um_filter_56_8]